MAKLAEQRLSAAAPFTWTADGFGAIYAAYAQAIYSLTLRLPGDPTPAGDATHDVILKASRKFGQFRGKATVRIWRNRIAVNQGRNLLQNWHAPTMVTAADDTVWECAASTDDSSLRVAGNQGTGPVHPVSARPPAARISRAAAAGGGRTAQPSARDRSHPPDRGALRGTLHRAPRALAVAFANNA